MPTVTASRSYTSPPEQVFEAWLDPAIARQWLFHTPDGEMITAEIDPRVGGSFTLTERREEVDAVHSGIYIELDRPRRLVFDFTVEPYSEGQSTRVNIDIAPKADGSELTLTHEGVWDEWEERTQQGWEMLLGQLGSVLGK